MAMNMDNPPSAFGICLSGYRSVRNKLLTSVDFPSPDSPVKSRTHQLPNGIYHCKFSYSNNFCDQAYHCQLGQLIWSACNMMSGDCAVNPSTKQCTFCSSHIISQLSLCAARRELTNYHQCELKSLLHWLSVNLIRQIGKANIAWGLWVSEL